MIIKQNIKKFQTENNMTREEAIKILKARPYSGEVLEALETLVPEYNESEDEKIRKALLDYFSCTGDDNLMLNGVYVKDIIAYLDKMKEKLEQGKKQFYWKPTEEDIRLFNKAVTTNTSLSPQERAQLDVVRMKFKHCPYIKQKSEWNENEEDKKTIDEICNVIVANSKDGYLGRYSACELVGKLKSLCPQSKQEQNDYITPHKEFFKFIYDRLINVYKENPNVDYMRSFKERLDNLSFEEKQEWSKEDEKTLDCIINVLDRLGFEEYCKSSRDQDVEEERFYYKEIQCLKKLKSLCPQSKQEWSDKDESYLLTVINEMEANKKEAPEYEHKKYDTIILWLKFLPLSLKKRNEDIEKLCSNEWTKEDETILCKIIEDYETVDKTVRHNSMLFGKTKSKLEWLLSLLEKVKNNQPSIENEKASEENILDKPNNVKDVKFPFKAKVKANNKTVIISFGRLNKDRNQWIMYTSDYTNNFKEYMPKELELIKDE